MATESQIAANQTNAQHSTGPKTDEGKAASCLNRVQTGLTGSTFFLLPWEDAEEYDTLFAALRADLRPQGPVEQLLVEKTAQHQWLSQRALVLQHMCFSPETGLCDDDKKLALYLRYQTTHERAAQRCLNDLLKLRAERRKEKIGFESQQAKLSREQQRQSRERERAESHQAAEARRESAENRKQQLHKFAVLLAQAKLDNQALQNLDFDSSNPLRLAATNRIREAERAA